MKLDKYKYIDNETKRVCICIPFDNAKCLSQITHGLLGIGIRFELSFIRGRSGKYDISWAKLRVLNDSHGSCYDVIPIGYVFVLECKAIRVQHVSIPHKYKTAFNYKAFSVDKNVFSDRFKKLEK